MNRVVSKAWESLSKFHEMKYENFETRHPDGEKSQILSIPTTQMDYAPNLITMKKNWLFLSWLVGQLEFENLCLFFCYFKESSPVPKIQQIICLLLCVLFTTTTIELCSKFHPVLYLEQQILKKNLCLTR